MLQPCPIPNGAAGLHLLGNICRKSNRKGRAKQYYKMSLKLDPFLWTSYEYLCELGGADDLDPTSVFGVLPSSYEVNTSTATAGKGAKPLQDRSILSPSFSVAETPAPGGGKEACGFDIFCLLYICFAEITLTCYSLAPPKRSPNTILGNGNACQYIQRRL